jgi:hypothetical protein
MRILLLIVLLSSPCFADQLAASVPASQPEAQIQLDGTLYKKNGNWFLFVESSKTSFKKESFRLVLSPTKKKQLKNYLIEQFHITVTGDKMDCDPIAHHTPTCIVIDSIVPSLYRPLEKSLGK